MPSVRPSFIPPQTPTLTTMPPGGDGWLHEIKHDGFRTMMVIDRGEAHAYTRQGFDWTARYSPVVTACKALRCTAAVIDGEIVVEDEHGASDFNRLQATIAERPERLIFYAFDLLWLSDYDLRSAPLLERRQRLADLMAGGTGSPSPLRFSEHFEGDGAKFFAAAVKHGLEGVVSKSAASRYRSGPSRFWLKTKNMVEGEFIVMGIDRDKDGKPFAHVARPDGQYAGKAFIGSGPVRQLLIASPSPNRIAVRVRHLYGTGPLRHAMVRELVR